jgi:hypothetical protein
MQRGVALGTIVFTASGILRVCMASKGPGAGLMEMTLTLFCGSDEINPPTLDRADTPRLWTPSESRGDKTLEDVPQKTNGLSGVPSI